MGCSMWASEGILATILLCMGRWHGGVNISLADSTQALSSALLLSRMQQTFCRHVHLEELHVGACDVNGPPER